MVWPHNSNSKFSVKSCYHVLHEQCVGYWSRHASSYHRLPWFWQKLWKLCIFSKIKLIVWKVTGNYVPFNVNLFQKRIVSGRICPICTTNDETVEHLLLGCNCSDKTWFASGLFYDHNLSSCLISVVGFRIDSNRLSHPHGGDDVLANLCWLVLSIWVSRISVFLGIELLTLFILLILLEG